MGSSSRFFFLVLPREGEAAFVFVGLLVDVVLRADRRSGIVLSEWMLLTVNESSALFLFLVCSCQAREARVAVW